MNYIRYVGMGCMMALVCLWSQFNGATPARAPLPDQFRVLTYNVYTTLGAPGIVERLNLIAQSDLLLGYDVVILTELFHDETADQLLATMRTDYPYQTPVLGRGDRVDPDCSANHCWNSAEGQTGEGQPEDGGIAILSRWPILERHQYIYQSRCGIDALARKGFVYVTVDIEGTVIHVIGTHMQSDPTLANTTEAKVASLFSCLEPETVPESETCPTTWQLAEEAVRINQLAEMNTWIAQKGIPADHPIIIGGDFNVDKEGNPAEYEHMLCTLNVSVPIYGGDPALESPWYTYDGIQNKLLSSEFGQSYLDYILVRDEPTQMAQWQNVVLRPTAYPSNWDDGAERGYELSDHFPVVGFFADTNRANRPDH